ncbi:VIT1/CCC1 transporter family protein [Tunturibacter empetritectus]|uniref:Membrane protein (TIGR00267 family) n=1 Tax=Tunturiibacter lichenicola TaxID=2051959 RepID=A0A7W8N4Q6_9BACT|nr:VIT1/CCC1 transporter family protein [Edaphobacter lichenicola]MBB5345454.1 putative membrane protein (TIGR00267 family) [Edaphobacter lichenicola]
MTESDNKRLLAALAANWQAEMDGHYTYSALAKREDDPQRRNALRGLAAAEKHHADLWAGRILELGGQAPRYTGSESGQADSLATQIGGADLGLRRLEIDEGRDIAKYGKQLKALGDKPSIAILKEVIADEREHYQTLGNLIRSRRPLPAMTPEQSQEALDSLLNARKEGHPQAAGWVGDAIYGINDGLGSIFGIVSGVSGATLGNSHFVLIAGLAGMAASALSMGSGAYLASKSEREIFEAEFAREREAVEDNEAEAREVLSLSYQIRGLPEEDAEHFVEHIARDKEQLVKALARERLNTSEEALRKPLVSAVSGALSTAVGALIPIIPFFFMNGIRAVIAAAIVSLIAHFAVGAAKSFITIRSWWSSGLEMTIVGAVEGVVTYVIGIGLGRIGGGQ